MKRKDPNAWRGKDMDDAMNQTLHSISRPPGIDSACCTEFVPTASPVAAPAVSPVPPSLAGTGRMARVIAASVLGLANMGTAHAQFGFGSFGMPFTGSHGNPFSNPFGNLGGPFGSPFGSFGGTFPGGPAWIGDDFAMNYDPNLPGYCIGSGGFGPCARPPARPPVYNPPVYNPPVYNPPVYNPPVYNPPVYNPPVYNPPPYNPPPYNPPPYNPPVYNPPPYNPPPYNPPVYNPPPYNPPPYNPPVYNPPPSSPPPPAVWCAALGHSVTLQEYSFDRCALQKASKSGARVVTGKQPADGKSPHILEVAVRDNNGYLVDKAVVLFAANPVLSFDNRTLGEEGDCLTNYSGTCRVSVTSSVAGEVSTAVRLFGGAREEVSGTFTMNGVLYGPSPLTYRFGDEPKGLELVKQVRNVTQDGGFGVSNTAKPGDVLEYRITYSNNLTHPVSGLEIADLTPKFTSFVSAQAKETPAGLTRCEKRTPMNPAPAARVDCSAEQVAEGRKLGDIAFYFQGTVQPAATGSVLFRVKVD